MPVRHMLSCAALRRHTRRPSAHGAKHWSRHAKSRCSTLADFRLTGVPRDFFGAVLVEILRVKQMIQRIGGPGSGQGFFGLKVQHSVLP